MMFDSIRIRLTIWYVGILAAFIIVFSLITYFAMVDRLDRDLDIRLTEIASSFKTAAVSEEKDQNEESKGDHTRDSVKEASDEMRLKDFPFIIYGQDGEVIATTADFDRSFDYAGRDETFRDIDIAGSSYRVYRTDLPLNHTSFNLSVFHSLAEKEATQRRLSSIFVVLVPLTLILAGLVGSLLAKKALAPVAEMGRQAEHITANNLSERLVIKNKSDELGQLAVIMNELLERLHASFEQQKRFMADASHELRTPIAIVRGESEVALSKQDRSTDEYRESLSIVHDESERLTRIVEDLFTLARADAGQFRTHFVPVYLNDIVSDSVRSIGVLARARDIRIEVLTNGEMPMYADEPLLRRLFTNLLDNAVKYNRSGGSVFVRCETINGHYTLRIADTGSGIPAAEQPNIFDRFYRVNKSRSRSMETETSGAGLGLSIAQWIAELHRGRIELVSSSRDGSVFSATFPR
jgi:two-component system, OmpR family, sensor kinase